MPTRSKIPRPRPIELKPCPFCGGEAKVHKGIEQGVHYAYVRCTGCGIHTNTWYCTAGEATEAPTDEWNRRVTDAN